MVPRNARGRRVIRLILIGAAALAAVLFLSSLPPRARATRPAPATDVARLTVVKGAFHVHTTRSDGTGSVDDVAAAAARAGLTFVILTDHGTGTRAPLPPSYKAGVLVIDGVEISSDGGHYATFGLPQTPFPLGGAPHDVVEDVARFGGFGVAAHPDSPKPELAWTAWDAPIDGIEWLNLDTEWRDEPTWKLAWRALQYPWRPPETLAALFAHARGTFDRWDGVARLRRTVGLVAVDAHARIGAREGEPVTGLFVARAPSYETLFRTLTLRVELTHPLSANPAQAAQAVEQAIRDGRVYSAIDALAGPADLTFAASSGARTARMGEFLPVIGNVHWTMAAAAPEGATLRLVCDGQVLREVPAQMLLHHEQSPGGFRPSACRPEVGWTGSDGGRVTWVAGNPIYLRASDPRQTQPHVPPTIESFLIGPTDGRSPWTVEHDGGSQASVTADPRSTAMATTSGDESVRGASQVTFHYALTDGARVSQYAALVTGSVKDIVRATRVSFDGSADRPMRISVQLRRPLDDGTADRWRRSIYLDRTPRTVTVQFDRLLPVGATRTRYPPLDAVHALLFVVDLEHTEPGAQGEVHLRNVRFER